MLIRLVAQYPFLLIEVLLYSPYCLTIPYVTTCYLYVLQYLQSPVLPKTAFDKGSFTEYYMKHIKG